MTTPTERSARRAAIRAAKERAAKATPDANDDECAICEGSEEVQYLPHGGGMDQLDVMACPCVQAAVRGELDRLRALRSDVPLLADDADRYHDLVERVEALAQAFQADADAERRFNLRVSCGPQTVADKLRAVRELPEKWRTLRDRVKDKGRAMGLEQAASELDRILDDTPTTTEDGGYCTRCQQATVRHDIGSGKCPPTTTGGTET